MRRHFRGDGDLVPLFIQRMKEVDRFGRGIFTLDMGQCRVTGQAVLHQDGVAPPVRYDRENHGGHAFRGNRRGQVVDMLDAAAPLA